MNDERETSGSIVDVSQARTTPQDKTAVPWWKRRAVVLLFLLTTVGGLPTLAHAQLGILDSIFSSIQSDMGSSLSSINQMMQATQKLYQTTVWPLAAINQARGFVSNSITQFRSSMNQAFNTPFTSAVSPGPQQFEALLHSRQSAQISALQTSFTSNYGTVPQANAASPQDRIMMDMDDALGQQNLKTTLVADQGADVILQTANQMENQVAVSTPGSNPYLTAQAQVANLAAKPICKRCLPRSFGRKQAGSLTTASWSSAELPLQAESTA